MKFKSIQICRGLAAILVVISHSLYSVKDVFPYNFIRSNCASGVVFFFILSGFIIYYSKQSYINDPSKVGVYIKERFTRIYPVYWAYFFGVMMFSLLLPGIVPARIESLNLSDILHNLTLYPSLVWPYDGQTNLVIGPAWTLSYEVLFYLSFVLFILNKRIAVPAYICWFAVIVLYFSGQFRQSPFFIKFLLNPEIMLFFMGILLAFSVIHYRESLGKYHSLILWLGIVLFTARFMTDIHIRRFFSWGIPYYVLILGVVLYEDRKALPKNNLISFWVLLGDASYSIYLTHVVSMWFLNPVLKGIQEISVPTYMIIITILSVLMGLTCHLMIERPIMRKISSPSRCKNLSRRQSVHRPYSPNTEHSY
jgi:exopolysaccharide production protein ExoZ